MVASGYEMQPYFIRDGDYLAQLVLIREWGPRRPNDCCRDTFTCPSLPRAARGRAIWVYHTCISSDGGRLVRVRRVAEGESVRAMALAV